MEDGRGYKIGYAISWVLIFSGCWIYAINEYGFMLGVGLGWLPSAIAATLVSFLWPLGLLAIVGLIAIAYYG